MEHIKLFILIVLIIERRKFRKCKKERYLLWVQKEFRPDMVGLNPL